MILAPDFASIDELEDRVAGLLADVYSPVAEYVLSGLSEIVSGMEGNFPEEEIRDRILSVVRKRIAEFEDISVPKSDDVDAAYYSHVSEKEGEARRRFSPFSVALGASILFSHHQALQLTTGEMFNSFQPTLNRQYREARLALKEHSDKDTLFNFAKKKANQLPGTIGPASQTSTSGPFKISINPQAARRFTEYNDRATQWLLDRQLLLKTVDGMNQTLRDKLNVAIASGYSRGETAQQIIGRVENALAGYNKTPYYSARSIAKTEINGAANFGEYEFVDELVRTHGVKARKQWIQRQRPSKRKTHAAVHLTTKNFDEDFIVDGENMARPHDERASAKNVVRCDCRLKYFYDEGDTQGTVEGLHQDETARKYVEQVESETDPQGVGLAIHKLGDFKDVQDAKTYVRELYGVHTIGVADLDEMNALADTFDSLPSADTAIQIPLRKIELEMDKSARKRFSKKSFEGAYSRERLTAILVKDRLQWGADDLGISYRQHFQRIASHEVGHALHNLDPATFEKFASVSFTRVDKLANPLKLKGSIFNRINWMKKDLKPGFMEFISDYAATEPIEDFAETMSVILTNEKFEELFSAFPKSGIWRKYLILKSAFNF